MDSYLRQHRCAGGRPINVDVGETVFNGIINPECMPAGGPTALVLDDPDQNLCGQGDLVIDDGGNLHLVIDPLDGPSYAFVNTFNDRVKTERSSSTCLAGLAARLRSAPIRRSSRKWPISTADADREHPVRRTNGLLDDHGLRECHRRASTCNGTFDQCIINGVPVGSLLIDFGCVYDSLDNVDIGLFRTPFDAVPGLNQNGTIVG